MNQNLPNLPFPNREIFEEIIIGSLLQDTRIVHIAQSILDPDDFDQIQTKVTYEIILALYAQQIPVDLITVLNQLRKNGTENVVGGAKWLVEVTDRIGSTANFEYHCRLMKEWTMRKQVHKIATDVTDKLLEETESVQEIIDEMMKQSLIITGKLNVNIPKTNEDVLQEMWKNIEAGKGAGDPLTELTDLNNTMQGVTGGDLIVVAGRPGSGKSIMVSNILVQAMKSKKRTIIWSLEMTNEIVLQRLISKISDVPYADINNNKLSQDQYAKIATAESEIISANFKLIDKAGVSAIDIRSFVIQQANDEQVDTIVIDHGGLLNNINPGNQNSVEEIGNTTKSLKLLAKEMNCKVILLWQLNRKAADGKVPSLDDLRGSGRIEEDSDKVIFVHRPAVFNGEEEYFQINGQEYPTKGTVQFVIAKNRRGPIGSAVAYFDHKTFSFREISNGRDDVEQLPWD